MTYHIVGQSGLRHRPDLTEVKMAATVTVKMARGCRGSDRCGAVQGRAGPRPNLFTATLSKVPVYVTGKKKGRASFLRGVGEGTGGTLFRCQLPVCK